MEFKQLKAHLTHFGVATAFSTLLCIIAVILPYWMKIKGNDAIGLFESQHDGSSGMFGTTCNSMMSQIECGYLKSSKIAGVISIIFGGLSCGVYYLPSKNFAALPAFVAICGTLGQFIFGVMTIVIFSFFKGEYYTDDGVNKEYESPGASDLHFKVVFGLWIVAIAVSLGVVVMGYVMVLRSGYIDKSDDDDESRDYLVVDNKE